VRKEKQYQLLERLQGQEEAKRQAEDQVSALAVLKLSSFDVDSLRERIC
jgi:hypothetical protein